MLTLQWPQNVNPLELPDFESQARRLRFQAIGKACRKYGIRNLLLGHHADDQAETVLMRLADGHNGSGLQGIKACAKIPECWGIYGVHLSGLGGPWEAEQVHWRSAGYNARQTATALEKLPIWTVPSENGMDGGGKDMSIAVERGGIEVHRPLLGYTKDQLYATCADWGATWIEDETNSDPTLTPRNAVRHLLKGYSLPRALRKGSLLALPKHFQAKAADRNLRVNKLFQLCQIITFDLRSGGLIIRFPARGTAGDPPTHASAQQQINRDSYRAADLLRRVIELVTPLEHVHLQNIEFAVKAIFPALRNPTFTEADKDKLLASFTVAGVLFQRQRFPIPNDQLHKHAHGILDQKYVWLLTRQPHKAYPDRPRLLIPPAVLKPDKYSPMGNHTSIDRELRRAGWSDWQLYDGRYWIRVLNFTPDPVIVRPFQEQDLKPFRAALSPENARRLDELLESTAPAKVRWTLPVIATERRGVLAAVTLGIGVRELIGKVRWLVRYKCVDLGEGNDGVLVR